MRLLNIFCCCLSWFALIDAGYANCIRRTLYGEDVTWKTDTEIANGVKVTFDNLYVMNTIFIENNGELNANIHVNAADDIYLRNSGVMNVSYNIGDDATVTQVVYSADDLTDVGASFDILVEDANSLSVTDVVAFADGRNITFKNSDLLFDGVGVDTASEIYFVGDNSIYIADLDSLSVGPILYGIDDAGTVTLESENISELFVLESYVKDGNLYGLVRRETDYMKVLGNGDGRGEFLNALRRINDNDRLISALDAADTREALGDIMRRSGRMNPINMMRDVREMHLMDMHNLSGDVLNSISARFVFTDDADIYGTAFRLAGNITDSFSVSLNVFAGTGEHVSDTDEYMMYMISGAVDISYQGRRLMMRGKLGVGATQFDSGVVWNNGKIENNPIGISYYAMMDTGARFDVDENLFVTPFVGVMYDAAKIMNSSENNFAANIGADFGYVTRGYDVNYEYFARVRVLGTGDVMATVRMGVISEFDAAGGAIEVSKIFGDVMSSYEIKANLNFAF